METHKKVDKILMPHIENTEMKNGVLVSPTPLKIPSKIIRAPNMGSETATILKTEAPE